jgi:hypothetical protein
MYLKCNRRVKDGKEHRYWSIMENRRCSGGRLIQRPVLYLGEKSGAIAFRSSSPWLSRRRGFHSRTKCLPVTHLTRTPCATLRHRLRLHAPANSNSGLGPSFSVPFSNGFPNVTSSNRSGVSMVPERPPLEIASAVNKVFVVEQS